MPVPGFLSSFADKAQSAINASPLAGHLPTGLGPRPSSPDTASQPPANQVAAQGGHKSHALESIQHQFRALQQQYSTTSPVQRIITTEKGVAIDFDSVSRDSKAQSKELYTWGQTETDDLKDVTDRLAYLNFVQGSLASTLALKLDTARSPFKALRDAEASLQPRRNIRLGIQNQLSRVENDPKRADEFRGQLKKAELEDAQQEKDIELLKRKAIRESEQLKWEAIREYGEKLVLLAQAATPIIIALPTLPPTPTTPYTGFQATGAARASLQRALDNYKTGHINLPPHPVGSDLSRSDTRSFGESHASELSSLSSDISAHGDQSGIPVTPQVGVNPLPAQKPADAPVLSTSNKLQSPPIDLSALNQSPALIPSLSPSAALPISAENPAHSALPIITPTVAETGVPVVAGESGPGPAKGSLHDLHASPQFGGRQSAQPQTPVYGAPPGVQQTPKHETAEEEKKRLAASYSQIPTGSTSATQTAAVPPLSKPAHETAEEEKKRLEREERERILRADVDQSSNPPRKDTGPDEDLPPYQEPTL